jgi:DHA1 family inner membrane transport protein
MVTVKISKSALALWALGLGGFALGTGEFVIMGLLPEVARDLDASIPATGRLISAYALGVVIGAPALAVLAARWPRRRLLIALMAFCVAANLATVTLPGYLAIATARFGAGLPHGAYFGVAALVAAELAATNQRARAVGLVMLGLTSAILVGAPLATWLGQQFGWRAGFGLVCIAAALAMALIRYGVPDLPADQHASPMRELHGLLRPQVWLTLAIAGIGFGGMFCVFSYIKPTLLAISGVSVAVLPLMLSLFGLGSVAGNLIGARLADRALMPTIGGVLIYSAVLLASFGTLIHQLPTAMLGVFLLGGIVSLGPALQIRLMDVAGNAQTLAAALNHSAFNAANALGAWLGGAALGASWSLASLGWVGAALAVGGLLVFAMSLAFDAGREELRTD